ncbi:hypothetical protein BX600DRAFT_47048 [Xylariales sp. PMI_506]|nr:hypothetical protein BX600DRAFT_47048 [Xylariales sp. PMI_506]
MAKLLYKRSRVWHALTMVVVLPTLHECRAMVLALKICFSGRNKMDSQGNMSVLQVYSKVSIQLTPYTSASCLSYHNATSLPSVPPSPFADFLPPLCTRGGHCGCLKSRADIFIGAFTLQYNYKLPVINTGSIDHPNYVPLEACYVLEGKRAHVRLSEAQSQKMILFTVRKPALNKESILNHGLRTVGLDSTTNARLVRLFRLSKIIFRTNTTNRTNLAWKLIRNSSLSKGVF